MVMIYRAGSLELDTALATSSRSPFSWKWLSEVMSLQNCVLLVIHWRGTAPYSKLTNKGEELSPPSFDGRGNANLVLSRKNKEALSKEPDFLAVRPIQTASV
jgi:hypothetical protein